MEETKIYMLENQLIEECKNGDGEAYRRLMNNYRYKLYGYLWRFSDSKFIAEELFQETLIKVWKGIKKYNHQRKFSSWLFTIAHNVAMDNLRMRKSKNKFSAIEEINESASYITPEEQLIENETIELINNSIKQLPEKQRAVFLLRHNGDMSFKEIADTMREPLSTVLSHMRYAVRKIKKHIENENESRKETVI